MLTTAGVPVDSTFSAVGEVDDFGESRPVIRRRSFFFARKNIFFFFCRHFADSSTSSSAVPASLLAHNSSRRSRASSPALPSLRGMATESGEAADPAPVEAAVDICDLPRDALYDILARADPRGAAALASACRRLRETTAFPGAERTWREVALRSWRCVRPDRYLVLNGEEMAAEARAGPLGRLLRGRAATRARGREGAWRALCGRGNHASYTEEVFVDVPTSVAEHGSDEAPYETFIELAGRRFALRAYCAAPHAEEEDAGTLHPSYGVGVTVELEMATTGETASGETPEPSTSSPSGKPSDDPESWPIDAPISAHVLLQFLRRPEDPEDASGSTSPASSARSRLLPPALDPLTGAARLVTFHRFDPTDTHGGSGLLRLSRCVPCTALHAAHGRFVHDVSPTRKAPEAKGSSGVSSSDGARFRLRVAALLHEDEDAAAAVPGWRRAGGPRGPADVAGARAPLLELALRSPEVTRRRVASEMYLLWFTLEGIETRWRRTSWYGRIGGGRVGVSSNTARLGAGSGTSPERAGHNVARVLPTILKLIRDRLENDAAGGSAFRGAAVAAAAAEHESVAQTAALVLLAYSETEATAQAMVRANALETLRHVANSGNGGRVLFGADGKRWVASDAVKDAVREVYKRLTTTGETGKETNQVAL